MKAGKAGKMKSLSCRNEAGNMTLEVKTRIVMAYSFRSEGREHDFLFVTEMKEGLGCFILLEVKAQNMISDSYRSKSRIKMFSFVLVEVKAQSQTMTGNRNHKRGKVIANIIKVTLLY